MRFLQGVGDNLLGITCFCIVTQIFRDEMMLYVGYAEVAINIGLGIGPILGQATYDIFQTHRFEKTMYVFAVINLAMVGLCYFLFPDGLNNVIERDESESVS